MTWLRKMRPLALMVGIAIGIGTLIGARTLTGTSTDASAKPGDAPRSGGGPVVLGTVDTDPPPVYYGLPPVLQSGVITKVHVKDGVEVKADQPLYEFDATIPEANVKSAKAGVAYAKTKVNEAKELVTQHDTEVSAMKEAVKVAERKKDMAGEYYRLVKNSLETLYKSENIPMEKWPEKLRYDPNHFKANAEYATALSEWELAKVKLAGLETVNPQVKVDEAEAAVKQADAELAKAQSAVDLCVVRAKMPGTIEQVTIGPGTTMGVSTRTPALWLIPAGPRVVRAEIESEFAHRVGPNLQGKTVTIYDHSDPKLTYSGTVRRIGTTFLLKRSNTENFLGGDTRVIEVVVEVNDPAPTDKPPLRIGQRVRVNLGQ